MREGTGGSRAAHANVSRLPVSPGIARRRVILVDEGVETGASIRAAIAAVRAQGAAEVILAVPVAPFDVLTQVCEEVDEVVCIGTPYPYGTIASATGTSPT